MKPTPEEKCPMLTVAEMAFVIFRSHFEHKTLIDVEIIWTISSTTPLWHREKVESFRSAQAIHAAMVKPSPSPEARVDLEKEREFLISVIEDMRCENKLHGHITDASAKYLIWKAKQATFEKGREAR
jgi:hypothetical protein